MSQLSHTDAVLDRVLTRIVSAGNQRSQTGRSPARSIGSVLQQRDLSTGRCISGVDKRRAGSTAKLQNTYRSTNPTFGGASTRDSSLAGTTATVVPQLVFSRSILQSSGSLQLSGPAASSAAHPVPSVSTAATATPSTSATSAVAGVAAPPNAILRHRAQRQPSPQPRFQAPLPANHTASSGVRRSPNSRRQHEGLGSSSEGGGGGGNQSMLRSGGGGAGARPELAGNGEGPHELLDGNSTIPRNLPASWVDGAAAPHALSGGGVAAQQRAQPEDAATATVVAPEEDGGARRGGRGANTITRTAALRALKQQRSNTPERLAEARMAAEQGSGDAGIASSRPTADVVPPPEAGRAGANVSMAREAAGGAAGSIEPAQFLGAADCDATLPRVPVSRAGNPPLGISASACAGPAPSRAVANPQRAPTQQPQRSQMQATSAGSERPGSVFSGSEGLFPVAQSDGTVRSESHHEARSRATSSASTMPAAAGYAAAAVTRVAVLGGLGGWGRAIGERSPSPRRGSSAAAAWPAGGPGLAASGVAQRQQRAMRQHVQRQTSPSPGRGSAVDRPMAAVAGWRAGSSLSPPPQRPVSVEPRQQQQRQQPPQERPPDPPPPAQQDPESRHDAGMPAAPSQSRMRRLEEQVVALSAQVAELQASRADLEFQLQEEQQQVARKPATGSGGGDQSATELVDADAELSASEFVLTPGTALSATGAGASTPREHQHREPQQQAPRLLDQVKDILDSEADLKDQLVRARAANETLATQNRTLYSTLEETLSAAEQAAQELKQLRVTHAKLQADQEASQASVAQLTEELGLRERALAAVQAEFSALRRRHEEALALAEASRRDGALREARLRRELELAAQEAATTAAALAKLQREHQQLHVRKADRDRQLAALAKKAETQQEQLATAARVAQESAALVRELESRATLLRTRNTALDRAVAAEKEARQAAQEQVRQMEEEIALLVAIVRQSDPSLGTLVRYKGDPAAAAALAAASAAAAAEALLHVSPSPDSAAVRAAGEGLRTEGGDTSAGTSPVVASSTTEPGAPATACTTGGSEEALRLGTPGGHAVVTITPATASSEGREGAGLGWVAQRLGVHVLGPSRATSPSLPRSSPPATALAMRAKPSRASAAPHSGTLSQPGPHVGMSEATPCSEPLGNARDGRLCCSSRENSPMAVPYPAKHDMTGGLFLAASGGKRSRRTVSPPPQPRSTAGRSKSVGGGEVGSGSRRRAEARAVSTGGRRERTPQPARAVAGARMRPQSDLGSRPGHGNGAGSGVARTGVNKAAPSGGGRGPSGAAIAWVGLGGASSGGGALPRRSSTPRGTLKARNRYCGEDGAAAHTVGAFANATTEAAVAVSGADGEPTEAFRPDVFQEATTIEVSEDAEAPAESADGPAASATSSADAGSPSSSPLMAVPVSLTEGDRVLWAKPRRNRGSASCGGGGNAAAASRAASERTYAALCARRAIDPSVLTTFGGSEGGAVNGAHVALRRARTPEPRSESSWTRGPHEGPTPATRKRASTPGARISSTGRGAYILGGPAPITASISSATAKPRYSESAVELAALLMPSTSHISLQVHSEQPEDTSQTLSEPRPADTDLLPLSVMAVNTQKRAGAKFGAGTDMSQSLGLDEDSRTEMASPLKLARAYYERRGGVRSGKRGGSDSDEDSARGSFEGVCKGPGAGGAKRGNLSDGAARRRSTGDGAPEVFRASYAFDTPQEADEGRVEDEAKAARAAPASERRGPSANAASAGPAAGGSTASNPAGGLSDDELGAALRNLQLRQAQLLQELATTHVAVPLPAMPAPSEEAVPDPPSQAPPAPATTSLDSPDGLPVVASFSFPMTQPQQSQVRAASVDTEACRSSNSSLRGRSEGGSCSKKRTARRRSVTFADDVAVDPAATVLEHAHPVNASEGGGGGGPMASPRAAWRQGSQHQQAQEALALPAVDTAPRSPSRPLATAAALALPQSPLRSPRRPSVTAAAEAAAAAGAGVGGPLTALLGQLESGGNAWRTSSTDRGPMPVAAATTAAPTLPSMPAAAVGEASILSSHDSEAPRKARRTGDHRAQPLVLQAACDGSGNCGGSGPCTDGSLGADFAAGDDEVIPEELPDECDDQAPVEGAFYDAGNGAEVWTVWRSTPEHGVGASAGDAEEDDGAEAGVAEHTASVRSSLADQPDYYGAAAAQTEELSPRLGVSLYDNDIFDVADMAPEALLAVSGDMCDSSLDSSSAPSSLAGQHLRAAAAAARSCTSAPFAQTDDGGNTGQQGGTDADTIAQERACGVDLGEAALEVVPNGNIAANAEVASEDGEDVGTATVVVKASTETLKTEAALSPRPSPGGKASAPVPPLRLADDVAAALAAWQEDAPADAPLQPPAEAAARAVEEDAHSEPTSQTHADYHLSYARDGPESSDRWPGRSEGLLATPLRADSSLKERQTQSHLQLLDSLPLSRSSLTPLGVSSSLSVSSAGGSSSGDWALLRRPPSPSVKPLSLAEVLRRPLNTSR